MSKRILIDAAHPEVVRVALVGSNNRLEELDIETATKQNLKGNIYLARVVRVEPSLQAAFIEYGGNRHGFLPFAEIHPDYFQISPQLRQSIEDELKKAKDARVSKKTQREQGTKDGVDTENEGSIDHTAATDKLEMELQNVQMASSNIGSAESDLLINSPIAAIASARSSKLEIDSGDDGHDSDDTAVDLEEKSVLNFTNRFQIQEVIKHNQLMLIQVAKEERGAKGASLTTYITLAGMCCVLMPNTSGGGGVSRKIQSSNDRKRLKEIIDDINLPDTMSLIIRTAGVDKTKDELRADVRYLCKLWEKVREQTLSSAAPALIYEEPSLIHRAIRDLFNKEVEKVFIEGAEAYEAARSFMRDLTPGQLHKISNFRNQGVSLFQYYNVEDQIDEMRLPQVSLASGSSIVINQTEALVAIDINSGKSTKSQHIKETAFKTNMEAVEEIARQLRLRDLAGLIVIDFIDMEDAHHIRQVEHKMRDVMSKDRARVQIGSISQFGLMEMSRQRMRPSIIESNYIQCLHCKGTGVVRSTSASAIEVLKALAEECAQYEGDVLSVFAPSEVGYYLLNYKRDKLHELEQRYGKMVLIKIKSSLIAPDFEFEHSTSHLKSPVSKTQQATQTEAEAVVRSRTKSHQVAMVKDNVGQTRRRGRRGGKSRNHDNASAQDGDSAGDVSGDVGDKKKSWWQRLIS